MGTAPDRGEETKQQWAKGESHSPLLLLCVRSLLCRRLVRVWSALSRVAWF